jgi:colanic acid/amylovoran biosynthesis glycosyltransferase
MTNDFLSSRGNVLIFRTDLLPYSETFIPAQTEKFRIFTPFYAGLRRVEGVKLPEDRTVVAGPASPFAKLPGWKFLFTQIDSQFQGNVRRINPKLIHAHFEESGLTALPLAQRLKIPIFLTCQGYDVTQESSGWQTWPALRNYYRRRQTSLFKKFSLCFGVSQFICDQMVRRGYPPNKIRLHYTGVDTDRFRPDPSISKRPTILFVGRLVEKKGCSDLLLAMEKVAAKYPEVEVVIMGDGILGKELKSLAREKQIKARFCGVQPPNVILQAMREALLLCSPSVRSKTGDSEGLPNVVFEAQAVGIPVVGTRHAGIPEAVQHGVSGLLSPERDPKALAENILSLLADPPLRANMGAAARADMIKRFELSQQASLLEKTYLEFL